MTLSAAGIPVVDLIQEIVSAERVRALIDPSIGGRISVDFRGPPSALVDRLEQGHGVDAYFDGSTLHFTSTEQRVSAVIRLPPGQPLETFERSLGRLGIADPRFPLRMDPSTRSIAVSGPPRFVARVREAARLDSGSSGRDTEEEIRVFPLRFAQASDHVLQLGDESVPMKGVATLLKAVFSGSGDTSGRDPTIAAISPARPPQSGSTTATQDSLAPALSRSRRAAIGGPVIAPPAPHDEFERTLAGLRGHSASGANAGLPQIHADTRLNSVIVRDYAHRMPMHERLIRALDGRPRMIELHLRIIDADTATLRETIARIQASSMPVDPAPGRRSASDSSSPLIDGAPYTELSVRRSPAPYTSVQQRPIETLIKEAVSRDGRVRVVAEPRITVLDNMPAELGNRKSFVARSRIESNDKGGTVRIEIGTRLRITPQTLIDSDGTRRIRLAISLHDGALTGSGSDGADATPASASHSIDTTAIVKVGETLLIGGLTVDYRRGDTTDRPDRGAAGEDVLRSRSERIYLITPKIIDG